MKYWNRRSILFILLLVVTIFTVGFSIGFLNTEDGFDVVEKTGADVEDKPTEVIQTPENTQKVNYYLVSEEGGNIKLYYVDGDETTEIKSEKISLDVLPYDDISILSNGIKTDTADEALAIWENFIS